jgi:RNA polymerase sigma factor (sigma-70 family)
MDIMNEKLFEQMRGSRTRSSATAKRRDTMLTHERFAYLAGKYADTVFRVAFSYLKSREDADDVTQEVFIKLYSVDTEFESEEHIRNWLIRVTINQCRKQFRSPWRRLENIDDYAATLSFEDDNDRELFRAVMELEQKYRSVIFLYYYIGYSTAEIADLLRIPVNTVSTRLSRARARLRTMLTEVEHD